MCMHGYHVQLFLTPWALAPAFFQQEYWNGLPFPSPGESCWSRDQTRVSCVSCTGKRILYHWNTLKHASKDLQNVLFPSVTPPVWPRPPWFLAWISPGTFWWYLTLPFPFPLGVPYPATTVSLSLPIWKLSKNFHLIIKPKYLHEFSWLSLHVWSGSLLRMLHPQQLRHPALCCPGAWPAQLLQLQGLPPLPAWPRVLLPSVHNALTSHWAWPQASSDRPSLTSSCTRTPPSLLHTDFSSPAIICLFVYCFYPLTSS